MLNIVWIGVIIEHVVHLTKYGVWYEGTNPSSHDVRFTSTCAHKLYRGFLYLATIMRFNEKITDYCSITWRFGGGGIELMMATV